VDELRRMLAMHHIRQESCRLSMNENSDTQGGNQDSFVRHPYMEHNAQERTCIYTHKQNANTLKRSSNNIFVLSSMERGSGKGSQMEDGLVPMFDPDISI